MLNRLQGLLKSLKEHNVKYLVIGGIAAVLYGVPRATFDLDILIEATPENADALLDAFIEAGMGTASMITTEELLDNEVTIFKDRVRIDVQTSTPGLEFQNAWKNKCVMKYQEVEFFVASKADLILSKIAAGRQVDLEDVRLLKLSQPDETE